MEQNGAKEPTPTTTRIGADLDAFLDKAWSLLKRYWDANADNETKVINHATPDELLKKLDLSLSDNVGRRSFDQTYEMLENVLKYSVRTSHPRFMNQLYGSTDIIGVLGEIFTTFCNTNCHTFEVSPVFSLMEREVMRELCNIVGFPEGDGVFAPGGSFCNMYAMLMARNKAVPDIKWEGLGGKTLVAFTSNESHYSMKKGANLIGIGINNAVGVACNDIGQMIPEELEKAIEEAKAQGKVPFFVNSTAGSTVKGSFDDINAIADICEKHGVWLHIDAAWGGSVVMSPKRRHLLAGMERANSVTWDPHKGMGVPIQCAVVLTRGANDLMECNRYQAEYLFKDANLESIVAREGSEEAEKAMAELVEKKYDFGDKSLQCGRHVDSLKIWLMFKHYGRSYFENRIENAFKNRDHALSIIQAKPDRFKLVSQPMFLNLCFWYIPPSCEKLEGTERKLKIDAAVQYIRRTMVEEGQVYINYQPQGDLPNFFRPIFNSDNTTTADVDLMMSTIDRIGSSL